MRCDDNQKGHNAVRLKKKNKKTIKSPRQARQVASSPGVWMWAAVWELQRLQCLTCKPKDFIGRISEGWTACTCLLSCTCLISGPVNSHVVVTSQQDSEEEVGAAVWDPFRINVTKAFKVFFSFQCKNNYVMHWKKKNLTLVSYLKFYILHSADV